MIFSVGLRPVSSGTWLSSRRLCLRFSFAARRLSARPKSDQPFSGRRCQVFAINLLGLGEPAGLHQDRAERVAHRDHPGRRLIVFQRVLLLSPRSATRRGPSSIFPSAIRISPSSMRVASARTASAVLLPSGVSFGTSFALRRKIACSFRALPCRLWRRRRSRGRRDGTRG